MEGLTSKPIPDRMFFRIRDVADILGVKPYVLRYWETEFPMIVPEKSKTGQRVYKRTDLDNLLMIKHQLYQERYSIEGARKRIQELEKEGELKAFKTTNVANQVPGQDAESRQERAKQIKAKAKELKILLRTPDRDLFKY